MPIADLTQVVPNDFVKLGYGSLKGMSNARLKPRNNCLATEYELSKDLFLEIEPEINNKLIRLWRRNDEIPVFGIDTSNILLGNTGDGVLCAVRGSVVWRINKAYNYVRHGPFVFHITEQNKYILYDELSQICLDADISVGPPVLDGMIERIRFILERWLQRQLCKTTKNSLILWDGSLTTRTINKPVSFLGTLLSIARKNHNFILAFSKKSTLTVSGQKVGDLIDNSSTPCILDVDNAIRSHYGNTICPFGRIYVTKLSPSPFAFRLDIDRRIPKEEGLTALEQLLGNDLLKDSYPETLRLAHIISRFSASEVIAMQRYVAETYGLRIDPKFDVRKILFGPYCGSNSRWMNGYDASL